MSENTNGLWAVIWNSMWYTKWRSPMLFMIAILAIVYGFAVYFLWNPYVPLSVIGGCMLLFFVLYFELEKRKPLKNVIFKDFKQLLEDFYQFINDNHLDSIRRLMLDIIQSRPNFPNIYHPNEMAIINDFYWNIRTLFESGQMTVGKSEVFIERFNSFLNSFNNNIMKDFIGAFLPRYNNSSEDFIKKYTALSQRYNDYMRDYEKFSKKANKPLSFSIEFLPVSLSDVIKI